MKNIFSIRELKCAYYQDKEVLKVKSLDIPHGKIVFIIGRSGIGKSTLLEILGLMNNPFVKQPESKVEFSPGTELSTNLLELWNSSDQVCSEFRKRHYSFMFQHTNLMPNFTCGENMMISLLINGRSKADAKKIVLEVMDRLSLEPSIFAKNITEISGGQRQRLSFVRAVTAEFSVLFGDEPTGNLDVTSAHEIMSVIRELVHDQNKSCIIVSHDLQLAESFADVVIPITTENNHLSGIRGEIHAKNILYRGHNQWSNDSENGMLKKGTRLVDCLVSDNTFIEA